MSDDATKDLINEVIAEHHDPETFRAKVDKIATARYLIRELLERWREADYHWALEYAKVDRWQDWTPCDSGDHELIARVVAFLGDVEGEQ